MLGRKLTSGLLSLTALLMASCASETDAPFHNDTGLLYISLVMDNVDDAPVADLFSLDITDVDRPEYFHHWDEFSQFRQGSRYLAGRYTVEASHGCSDPEGYDSPAYSGRATIGLVAGEPLRVALDIEEANTPVEVRFAGPWTLEDASLTMYTPGGKELTASPGESRTPYFRPAPLTAVLAFRHESLGERRLLLADDIALTAGRRCTLSLDYDASTSTLTALRDNEPLGPPLALDAATLAAAPPQIAAEGFTDGATLALEEFTVPPSAPAFAISSAAGLRKSVLNVVSPVKGVSRAVEYGPEVRRIALDDLIALLAYTPDGLTAFTLTAVDSRGVVSEPAVLYVRSLPSTIAVESVMPSLLGDENATVVVTASEGYAALIDRLVFKRRDNGETIGVTAIRESGKGRWEISLAIDGGADNVDVDMYLNGTLMDGFTVSRETAAFAIEADAFASYAIIRLTTDADAGFLRYATEKAAFRVDGTPATVFYRDPSQALVALIGLSPSKSYKVEAVLGANAAATTFTTEDATPLPNGDFDDAKPEIKYDGLPSGGRYSQTIAEIFNQQNTVSYNLKAPTRWANTNAKTFCRDAKRQNTWYMQPSVYTVAGSNAGGDLAVELVSTAFDPAGPPIPDYLQKGRPYIDYSLNIPAIAFRAAAKLFLGSYSFDAATMTETYNEGIAFGSRPTGLNGYYRYTPSEADPDDCGLAIVEVTGIVDGVETTIANGVTRLGINTDYTTFTVSLRYTRFGIKASRLKVMFCSSAAIGSIAEESAAVMTVSDPRSATSTGSRLTLDNIMLSY